MAAIQSLTLSSFGISLSAAGRAFAIVGLFVTTLPPVPALAQDQLRANPDPMSKALFDRLDAEEKADCATAFLGRLSIWAAGGAATVTSMMAVLSVSGEGVTHGGTDFLLGGLAGAGAAAVMGFAGEVTALGYRGAYRSGLLAYLKMVESGTFTPGFARRLLSRTAHDAVALGDVEGADVSTAVFELLQPDRSSAVIGRYHASLDPQKDAKIDPYEGLLQFVLKEARAQQSQN